MESQSRRHRSSTAASRRSDVNNSPLAKEVNQIVENLFDTAKEPTKSGKRATLGTLQVQCIDLRRLRQLLIDSADRTQAKDAFRHARGFTALLDTLRSVKGFYNSTKLPQDELVEFFELLKNTLEVFSEALSEHPGNRRYFKDRVEGNGWVALEQTIADTGVGVGLEGSTGYDPGFEQLFGCLLAFAVGEETMTRIFRDIGKIAKKADTFQDLPAIKEESLEESGVQEVTSTSIVAPNETELINCLTSHIRSYFDGNEVLQNPQVLPFIFRIWARFFEIKPPSPDLIPLSAAILLVLRKVLTASLANKLAFHESGCLSIILPILFEEDLTGVEHNLLKDISEELISLGINHLDDAYYLFDQASQQETATKLLASGMKSSRQPACIQFDLTRHGFSSLELADLGRTFPPQSAGYTLTFWLKVDNFDKNCHTTIFGAYDASQTCFVLAYLEKDTRNFILQTSITSSKPSIRFKSTVFEAGIWYHIALVHRRPKPGGTSKAALFVNGEFAEQQKCYYPASPPIAMDQSDSFASLTSMGQKKAPVQAFLGTPQDLASRLGRNVVSNRWSLASCHLFDEALTDELVAVHQKLGPRYNGNFQDCLGSFQTYRASAELNLYNELLHPGKEEKSQIVQAIRLSASTILPESRILLSISPLAVMDDDNSNTVDESQLVKSLSKRAAKCLHLYTLQGGNPIAINAAVPSINEALTHPYGVAVLTGSPVVVVPQALDDASWRVAGCAAVGLKLVQLARTPDSVLRSVGILFDSVAENWRNSESMERENGFGVLAALIREKLGFGSMLSSTRSASRHGSMGITTPNKGDFALRLLKSVLQFVGYNEIRPEDSIIINPLAYRILLVDFDMWRNSSPETQKYYYRQLWHFAKGSKQHHFNAKRLNRMRLVKKLLDALKGETFLAEVFPSFLEAFEGLIRCSMSGETLRSLALYITFSLQDGRASYTRTIRAKSSVMRLRSRASTPNLLPGSSPASRSRSPAQDFRPEQVLTQQNLGVRVLEMYAKIICDRTSYNDIRKFAKTVTNKWLLYLLAETDPRVVISATKILARLLVTHGAQYLKKFSEKTGGFVILKQRLRNWWNTPAVWTICFAILFGMDVAHIDFDREFDLYNLVDMFLEKSHGNVVYPEILPVMTTMLGAGLRTIVRNSEDEDTIESPSKAREERRNRARSMSLETDLKSSTPATPSLGEYVAVLQTVIQFFGDLHSRSDKFRDFAVHSSYVQELLFVLYPVIVTSDSVSADTELNSRGSALTFEGQDVVIRSHSKSVGQDTAIVRTTVVDTPPSPNMQKAVPIRRGSSFVLLSSDKTRNAPSSAKLNQVMSPKKKTPVKIRASNTVVQALLETVIAVFQDQLFQRKDFPGFGLFLKVPPGFQEHQAYFESYILRHAMSSLSNALQLERHLLWEPRVLTNLARYSTHMAEALFEGWFLNGAEPLLEFVGNLLDYLQQPDVLKIKGVRLCTTQISSIRTVFLRVVLLRLSELDESGTEGDTVAFIEKMVYWQTIILSPENSEEYFLKLICYMLYTKLIDTREKVRLAAADFWRMTLVHKPTETSTLLSQTLSTKHKYLSSGFMKLMEIDNEVFLEWVDGHRQDLDDFFFGAISKTWDEFVGHENHKIEDGAKTRVAKRKEKLSYWKHEEDVTENVLHRHDISTNHWRANIHASERLKHQRAIQDQQENLNFIATSFEKLENILKEPCKIFGQSGSYKWQLDPTEGRNRMRMRLLPDKTSQEAEYQPKRSKSNATAKENIDPKISSTPPPQANIAAARAGARLMADEARDVKEDPNRQSSPDPSGGEDDYEIIDDPKDDEDSFEDKNRKVMRSLQHGDVVQHVCNVSRIVGLEAVEGLFILGKSSLYLLDHFFQRSDGEILRVWQAPVEERDPYLQLISGREANPQNKPQTTSITGEHSRNWKWEEVLSISKRRFLFRDVAIEIFFTDGRSYLLTVISPETRNDIYNKLIARAPQVANPASALHPDDLWRLESLRTPEDAPQTFGYKFANVFASQSLSPGTRKWMKGEISNFHYLMLVNTMAGRTFNDLTQYPVFPWVLADYTSEELDLDNPKTFRDFSKPMGAQTPSRESEFRDRYQSFAEMGDQNAPPFHYGTHYSSAMIVSSYLIRLQPFVQSYLLLQGGNFDHADRMFFSIERAWLSASRDNMTDVRELTPEFFYLPEFLTNVNGYNFGLKQQSGDSIDTVELPPWAKGSPEIFIQKHREALESPYVSRHLHEWIDLIFGQKQRGEAAMAATNVFHYLSYHGAKDLDNIEDPVERLATIGIIHNFGQTPHQVFQRAHPNREDPATLADRYKRLSTAAESLIRLPSTLLESHERVASLLFSSKQDRLLCSAAFRLNIPPNYDRYMEWGFADGSVRFYATDTRRLLGIFEHMHAGQVSCATFVDGKTLITAGTDCAVSAWTLTVTSKTVDLTPKFTLFGHRTPVTVLATSRALGAFLSVSRDGRVLVWDLNRREFVRELEVGDEGIVTSARINDVTGHIILCGERKIRIFTLNGTLLLEQDVCGEESEQRISSCAVYEGLGNEWIERELVLTGHRWGIVNIWHLTPGSSATGNWVLRHIKQMNHVDVQREGAPNYSTAITCILPMPNGVFTGDEDGRVWEWDCLQKHGGSGLY